METYSSSLENGEGSRDLSRRYCTGQIAEALPGGVSIFAEAYRRQTGKDLGVNASSTIQDLLKAMKDRKVRGDILTYAAQVASERAAPSIIAASKASQAEQDRFGNAITDLSVIASDAGVESGFARLFRSLANGLKESGPLVERLAGGFDSVTKYASYALLSFQSIQRFFDGKDSYLGKKFFPSDEDRAKAFLFLETFKNTFAELSILIGNTYDGLSKLTKLVAGEGFLTQLERVFKVVGNGAAALNALVNGDYSEAGRAAVAAGGNLGNAVTTPGRIGANLLIDGANAGLRAIGPGAPQIPNIEAPFTPPLSDFDWLNREESRRSKLIANRRGDNYNGTVGIMPLDQSDSRTRSLNPYVPNGGNSSGGLIDIKAEIKVNIDAATVDDFNEKFQRQFKAELENTLQQYTK